MKSIMCVPNISEGINLEVVEAVVDQVRETVGVKLLDYSSDADHNRSVITYIGIPEAVFQATQKLVRKAVELIDMSMQKGSHPRQGAVDVVPFIPIDLDENESVQLAHSFGEWVGRELEVPVYFYEDAAKSPERKSLVKVRKGQYEALEEKLKDPRWAPDAGPAVFVPKTGSIQVASRFPLVALNINLATDKVDLAQSIANSVRHLNGGFRYVRAMGLAIEGTGQVQVSMNLIHYIKTPIPMVMETVRREAARYGVNVVKSELVGPVPMGAMEQVMSYYLQAHDFSSDQIIEKSLIGWS
ncbi:glutamate formimidoyltransferase [Desulforhopalus singaporensis]|uniref:glutamate formimidoyltransferase n=1 Tax=Desulforhopalus singaporensis TaxID=91360 RepID=A0A1H0UE67_9BACT|nr:glutamate formimidoyltransferase [Desulforhopalus singaporensis]SDP64315.1 glutamate formiminotransferase [Desulforhopalus singaporensis]